VRRRKDEKYVLGINLEKGTFPGYNVVGSIRLEGKLLIAVGGRRTGVEDFLRKPKTLQRWRKIPI